MSQAGQISLSSEPSVPIEFVTNSGTAVPFGNALNILGSGGITTSGSGDTITISLGTEPFTPGSVIFAGAGGDFSQDNANFFYSASSHKLELASLQITGGASNNYVLKSDSSGNASWAALSGLGVSSITGTANQVLVNATTGSPQIGAVTLTLPQSIATTSNVTFNGLNLAGLTASQAVVTDGSKNLASLAYVSTGGSSHIGGTSNIVSRDQYGNTAFNNLFADVTGNVASGTITLTIASNGIQTFSSGSGSATAILPDATTLLNGWTYQFNNNASGIITVEQNGGGVLFSMLPGSYARAILISNSFSAGQWDYHWLMPANASYGTAGLTVTGTIIASAGLTVQSGGASILGTTSINATGTASTTIGNTGSGSSLHLYTGDGNLILDGSSNATMTIAPSLTTGSITIGGSAQNGNLTLGSSSATNALKIADGSGATTLSLAVNQTTGAINAGTSMTTGTITIGGTSQTGNVKLGVSSGVYTVDVATGSGAGTLNLASVQTGGTINIGTSLDTGGIINIGGTGNISGGASQTYIGSSAAYAVGIEASIIYINGGSTGTTNMGGTAAVTNNIIGTNTIYGPTIINSSGSYSTTIGNTGSASAVSMYVGSGGFILDGVTNSSYTIGSSTTTGTIIVGGSSQTGLMVFGSSDGTNIVGIGIGSGATTVDIATGATNAKTVNIATSNLASAIKIGAASTTTTITGSIIAPTFTAYSVLCGGTTSASALQNVSGVGTSGQILTSQGAGALPQWASPAASSITITGNTGGGLTGNSFTFSGGTTGLSFGGSGTTQTLTFAGITANGGTANINTDNSSNATNIGTGTTARTTNIGNVNSTAHTINIGNGTSATATTTNIQGVVNIATTGAQAVNIATGAFANTVTIGSTTTSNALLINNQIQIQALSGLTASATSPGVSWFSSGNYTSGFDSLAGTVGYVRHHVLANSGNTFGHIFSTGAYATPTTIVFMSSSGSVGIGTASPAHQLQLTNDDAAKPTTNLWTIVSDASIKTNITDTEEALPVIAALHPCRYTYTDEYVKEYKNTHGICSIDCETSHYGFIADEVEKVLPYCVNKDKNGLRNLNAHAINILMVKALQELYAQVQALQQQIQKTNPGV